MIKKNLGFTLLELTIVMGIVALLSVTAIPRYQSQIKKAKDGNVYALLGTYRSGYNLYLSDTNGIQPGDINEIESRVMVNRASFEIAVGTSSGSIQVLAGTVGKGGVSSIGYGDFAGKNNVAELYYDSVNGELYIDGTNGGTDYIDTKGEKWNEK